MGTSDLCLSFESITGNGSDIQRFPQQEVINVRNHNLCLLPVGESVNISAIPRYTVKIKI